MDALIWIGIGFCVTQSAMFSGLNLAFFSISKLRLEIESAKQNQNAVKVARLREDANFLLTTILWGNVGINVLLTLLSNSVMAGLVAFFFSTFVITFLGEIIPQAYFSRHALKAAAMLSPLLRFYQVLLYPLAKPSALVLDRWLGAEAIRYFRESDFRQLLKLHMEAEKTDIEKVEGKGALNFLAIDELPLIGEGEALDPRSIVTVKFEGPKPFFPETSTSPSDPFLKKVHASGKKWVVITDLGNRPRLVLNADNFLRATLFGSGPVDPLNFCHRPILVDNEAARISETITCLKVHPDRLENGVVDDDIILFWGREKRVITGSDILARLLRGIVGSQNVCYARWQPQNG